MKNVAEIFGKKKKTEKFSSMKHLFDTEKKLAFDKTKTLWIIPNSRNNIVNTHSFQL